MAEGRFVARVTAYGLLLTDVYPPFTGAADPAYPVRMEFAGPLDRYSRLKTLLRIILAIPILVLCAATGGYFLAKRSLAPVASMAAHAAKVSATNLNERLPVGGGDELAGLARIVNDLLDRLEHSFAQQRRFAHLFKGGHEDPRIAHLQAICDANISEYGLVDATGREG